MGNHLSNEVAAASWDLGGALQRRWRPGGLSRRVTVLGGRRKEKVPVGARWARIGPGLNFLFLPQLTGPTHKAQIQIGLQPKAFFLRNTPLSLLRFDLQAPKVPPRPRFAVLFLLFFLSRLALAPPVCSKTLPRIADAKPQPRGADELGARRPWVTASTPSPSPPSGSCPSSLHLSLDAPSFEIGEI